jgi:type IV pilus assembly protein PilA
MMIAVAIVGVIAAIAIPAFLRFQLKTKSSEAKVNLAAIRVAEQAHLSEHGRFLAAAASPPALPGTSKVPFAPSAGFASLGFAPEGLVYFSYAVAVSADGAGFTSEAAGDIDGNGTAQFWGEVVLDGAGAIVPPSLGCAVAFLTPGQIGPCAAIFGQSEF